MTLADAAKELWPLLLLGADWIADRWQTHRRRQELDDAVASIRKSLRSMGEIGDRAVTSLDEAIAQGKLKAPRGWRPTPAPGDDEDTDPSTPRKLRKR